MHLKDKSGTLGLLVTTKERETSVSVPFLTPIAGKIAAYPSSKCLHLFRASWALVLQTVHSSLNTTFLVVFAFLWKTGLV